MRILIVSPHFYPENFKCNDVAFDLAQKGHQVTVLSDIPNYPIGHYFPGYGIFKKRVEKVNGVRIIRTLVIPRGKGNAIRLLLNYASFAFFASFNALYLALFKKYDAVLVHETSPITVGIPALIVRKIQQIPMFFWVLDLWPESLSAAGGIKNKHILNFFSSIAKCLYRNSEKILISSKGFRSSIQEKGDFAQKIEYFPNWAETMFTSQQHFTEIPELPKGFKVMFAGNVGEAQDFEHIVEAALLLKDHKDIHFVIVGDGRKKTWVEDYVQKNNLSETVHLLGRYPLEAMPSFFKKADAMLVSLNDNLIFNLTVPAKLQAYMAAGKPILGMINGEAQNLIKDSQCGLAANAEDSKQLAENILLLSQKPKADLEKMGDNGFIFFEQNFTKEKCMNHLCDILNI